MKDNSFISQLVNLVKKESIQTQLRLLCKPLVSSIITECSPYIYVILLLLFLCFFMNLCIFLCFLFIFRIQLWGGYIHKEHLF